MLRSILLALDDTKGAIAARDYALALARHTGTALTAAILGGIGSVRGALWGGVLLGLFEAIWSASMPIESRDIAVYTILALVLILRPGGLFGERAGAPRPV